MSAERALQAAIVAALNADDAYVAAVPGGVHDGEAPEGAAMPYTVLGDHTETIERTHDLDGFVYTITVHDWSEYVGRLELQEIREARNAVLSDALLTVTGWGLTRMVYEFGEIMEEWDVELAKYIRHQVTRYRVYALATA